MFRQLPSLTALGAILAFCFSAYQYFDTKKMEERSKRFDQFHRVFEWVAGRTADGHNLIDTQQAMAVYELTEFPEYSSVSLPIIQYYLDQTSNDPDDSLFRGALLYAKSKLTSK